MKITAFTALALLLTLSAAQATEQPRAALQSTSKAGFGCSLLGGNALKLEVATAAYAVRMSIWGDGLGQLRGEKKIEINGDRPGEYPGTAEFCRKGSPCSPITARFELSKGNTVANTLIEGNMFWYDPGVDREVSLPLAATIAPKQSTCG